MKTSTIAPPKTGLKATKTKVLLGTRVVREGIRIPIEKFLTTVGSPTKKNLETLTSKFGIKWDYALDQTLSKNAKPGPARSFVVAGKTLNGKKVYFDRFQFILFVENNREKIHNVISMNKRQFEKFAA